MGKRETTKFICRMFGWIKELAAKREQSVHCMGVLSCKGLHWRSKVLKMQEVWSCG